MLCNICTRAQANFFTKKRANICIFKNFFVPLHRLWVVCTRCNRIKNLNQYTLDMNTSLQELTEKIYAEGVEKGKEQAALIVKEAEVKAAEIIAAAEKLAAEKKAKAEAEAAQLDKNTKAELKLYSDQALNALKTQVTNMLTDKLAKAAVAGAADKDFMQKIIADLVAQLAKEGTVAVEAKDAEALKAFFAKNAKELLEKGVKIEEVKGIKTDFAITPAKGGYKLTFGEAEFVEYFKEFLRPQLKDLLF